MFNKKKFQIHSIKNITKWQHKKLHTNYKKIRLDLKHFQNKYIPVNNGWKDKVITLTTEINTVLATQQKYWTMDARFFN